MRVDGGSTTVISDQARRMAPESPCILPCAVIRFPKCWTLILATCFIWLHVLGHHWALAHPTIFVFLNRFWHSEVLKSAFSFCNCCVESTIYLLFWVATWSWKSVNSNSGIWFVCIYLRCMSLYVFVMVWLYSL